MEKIILVISCMGALICIGWGLKLTSHFTPSFNKNIAQFLLSFTALRYVTLIIYAYSTSLKIIQFLRYFYFASSMGVTMLTAFGVWSILPFIRKHLQLKTYLACFLPWDFFYLYLIITQPNKLIQSEAYGYELVLTPIFSKYLSIVQGSFITIIVILCLVGCLRYRHLQIRVQLILIILAQGLLTLDGIFSGTQMLSLVKYFTLTEAFAIWVVDYAWSHPIKIIHEGKYAS